MSRFDVAVVGGGLAGATAAVGLGRLGFSVALIDPSSPQPIEPSEATQLRVSTFSPASKNILSGLGAWATVQSSGRDGPFDRMRVWERDARDQLTFSAADANQSSLGWVVENELVKYALWQQFESAGVEVIQASLAALEFSQRKALLNCGGDEPIQVSLVIGADGARSVVRESVGIGVSCHDYQQSGLVCLVETEQGHQDTAWQRFVGAGPLALLPLATGQCSVVWSLPTADAQRLHSIETEQFNAEITAALDQRLGAVRCVSNRVTFPLQRLGATDYIKGRVALLGDAAHVVHPLAGQGANLGLLDAAALIELLDDFRQAGRDLNDMASLQATLRVYQRWRRSDNVIMARSFDLIKSWFAQNRGLLADIRRTGTGLLNRNRFLRGRFVEHAAGFGGRVPALASPVPRQAVS